MYAESDIGKRHVVSVNDKHSFEIDYSDTEKELIAANWNEALEQRARLSEQNKLKETATRDAYTYMMNWIAQQPDAPQSVKDYVSNKD